MQVDVGGPMQGGSLNRRVASTRADLVAALQKWAQRLNAPRGRSTKHLCVAEWEPTVQLARVTREKGSDLHVFGVHREGQLYLQPAEALCLLEDGLLLLLHHGAPLSVQEAYALLLRKGGPLHPDMYAVFCSLHRNGFVCRPHAGVRGGPPCESLAASSLSPASAFAEPTGQPAPARETVSWPHGPLLDVYERRGFSRSAVNNGTRPPFSVAAVFSADSPMPAEQELLALAMRLSQQSVPSPLYCACVSRADVLFFECGAPAVPACAQPPQ